MARCAEYYFLVMCHPLNHLVVGLNHTEKRCLTSSRADLCATYIAHAKEQIGLRSRYLHARCWKSTPSMRRQRSRSQKRSLERVRSRRLSSCLMITRKTLECRM